MRLRQSAALGFVAALAGSLVTWAGFQVLQPEPSSPALDYTYVEVTAGEVGSSIALNVVARWATRPLGTNQATGIITSTPVAAGTTVSEADTLYTVNLRPVVIASGSVPAFRDLSPGTSGRDVRQLQRMLTALGRLSEPSGVYDATTERAVRSWQTSLGSVADGTVRLGDVVFVPATLPRRLRLDPEVVATGAVLSGGEPVLSALAPEPSFTLPVTQAQSAQMPPGTPVEIDSLDGAAWTALTGEASLDPETAEITVALASAGDEPICGPQCSTLSVDQPTQLPSRVVTQETVAGNLVPTAAILSRADGSLAVVDRDGEPRPVRLIASARGQSVVEGVDPGLRVRIPAKAT